MSSSAINSPLPTIRNEGTRLSMEDNLVRIQNDYSPINLNPLRKSVQNKQLKELKILTAIDKSHSTTTKNINRYRGVDQSYNSSGGGI